jgi:hypothetical protein
MVTKSPVVNRDSSVGIAISDELGRLDSRTSSPGRIKNFLLLLVVQAD